MVERGAARRRLPDRPLHVAASRSTSRSASSSTASRSTPRRFDAVGRRRARRGRRGCARTARLAVHADVLRGDDRDRVRAVPPRGVDVAVVEVGLGGRFDATNVITPRASAITSHRLRPRAAPRHHARAIAFEKAGIIKPGVPVVVGGLPAEARQVVNATARDVGAPLDARGEAPSRCSRSSGVGPGSTAVSATWPDLGAARPGAPRRASGRTTPSSRCGCSKPCDGLRPVDPGRGRGAGLVGDAAGRRGSNGCRLPAGPLLIDAAHNPAGAEALAAYLGRGRRAVAARPGRDAGQGRRAAMVRALAATGVALHHHRRGHATGLQARRPGGRGSRRCAGRAVMPCPTASGHDRGARRAMRRACRRGSIFLRSGPLRARADQRGATVDSDILGFIRATAARRVCSLARACALVAGCCARPLTPPLQIVPGWDTKQFTFERIDADRMRLMREVEINGERAAQRRPEDLRRRARAEHHAPASSPLGQRRLLAADRAHLGRARRLQHARRSSARSTTPRASPRSASAASGRSMFGTLEPDIYFYGETIEKIGDDKYRITKGGFTTCVQPTPRWEIVSGSSTRSTSTTTPSSATPSSGSRTCRSSTCRSSTTRFRTTTARPGFLLPTYGRRPTAASR